MTFRPPRPSAVLVLVLALLAAACADSDAPGGSTQAQPVATPAPPAASNISLPDGWSEILEDMRCEDTSIGAFPRTVVHDAGEATIAVAPERVVSIEGTTSLDLLLLMGVTPAGAGGDADGPALLDQQAALAGGTPEDPGFEVFAKRPEVNVEAIAALRPDLIISQSGWLEGIEDQIAGIGVPVVVFELSDDSEEPPDWRDFVRIVGQSVGRDACVEEIVTATEAAIADARASLRASGAADDTFAGFIATADGFQLSYGVDTQFGQTLVDELGLTLVPGGATSSEFSLEAAPDVLDADHVFAFDYADDGYLESFVAQPVVAPVRDRIEVLPPVVANVAFYPSALGVRLFVHEIERRFT